MNAEEHRDFCPRCGAAYEPLQEYCLECGARLPVNRGVVGVLASSWQRRLAWYPGDWIWPVLFFLGLTIVATTAVLVANASRSNASKPADALPPSLTVGPGHTQGTVPVVSTATTPNAPSVTITTGPLPTAPGNATTPTPRPPKTNPNALTFWPADKAGYTVVLESLPVAAGRQNAVARARRAKRNGIKDVGVLVSSRYSSLHPGYYVVFAGVYGSAAQAAAGVGSAHTRGFPDAYQTRVTR
jgi:hypothetical protein